MKIKQFLQVAALVALAGGIGPAYSAVWQWSRTASSNATADPTINWAEGMSPSSVNDSARAMMSRIADYRDDVSGSILTAGTSTAYTLTSHQVFDSFAHMDGAKLAFTASATNAATPSLNVDGLGAKFIVAPSGNGIGAGTIVAGTPYVVTYNNGTGEFLLQGIFASSSSVPLGGILATTLATAPNSSFILPAGQCISTTTYATYWVAYGSPAPGSCAAGQFQVMDLRGRTLTGLDNLNGTAANRLTSSATGCGTAMTSVGAVCANGQEATQLSVAHLPAYTPAGTNGGISVTATATTSLATLAFSAFNFSSGGGSILGALTQGFGNGQPVSTGSGPTFSGTAQGGTDTPFPRVTPIIAITYLLRVI